MIEFVAWMVFSAWMIAGVMAFYEDLKASKKKKQVRKIAKKWMM